MIKTAHDGSAIGGAMDVASVMDTLAVVLGITPDQLLRFGLMGLRILPLVALVPALGLQRVPLPFKMAMAIALGLGVAPVWLASPVASEFALTLAVREVLLGLPLAIGAAGLLWAATMAGDLIAASYRDLGPLSFDAIPGAQSALGVLLSLLCAIGFLELGGATRVLYALAPSHPGATTSVVPMLGSAQWWLPVVQQVLAAIDLALALASPMLAVAWVIHIAFALTARAAVPVGLDVVWPALRAVSALLLFAMLFQAMSAALFEQIDLRLP